ncbi:MAG: YbaB/EbfC family nucleoid-associated protein [Patescibacteria group bacterium]
MFNKLKNIKDLRDQAKTMQNALADESILVEKSGVKIEMNGNMEVTRITIDENLSTSFLEGIIAETINEAIKKTQRIMAQKMQAIGGFPSL